MDRAIFLPTHEWKFPLNIAIGLHILVLMCSLYLPGFFKAKPKFAKIYTVSIINVSEPAPAQESIQQETKSAVTAPQPIKPKTTKKIAPIAKEPTKLTSPAPKAVSLKPLRKKKKKKIVQKKTNSDRQKRLDRQRRQQLAEALLEEELLSEKARIAQEALAAEKDLLETTKLQSVMKKPSSKSVNKPAAGRRSGGGPNLIASQYNAAIMNRLLHYWALPGFMQKNPDLVATAVITIKKNGTIADLFFENKSGDRVFDQFVRKAILAADPLPPIPPAMKKQRYEIGLHFKPGSIQ